MRRSEGGFSLLEVLVAMCIIAIAFGAIYRAEAQGISMTRQARDVTYAGLLAQQKMAGLMSILPPYGLRRGDFGREFPGFWWQERVTGAKEFEAEMLHVQLSVYWGPGDAARSLTLEGYVLEPAEEEAGEEKPPEEAAPKEKQAAKKPAATKSPAAGAEDEEE